MGKCPVCNEPANIIHIFKRQGCHACPLLDQWMFTDGHVWSSDPVEGVARVHVAS